MSPLVDHLPTPPLVTWESRELRVGSLPLLLADPLVDGRPVIGASAWVLGGSGGSPARVGAVSLPGEPWPAGGVGPEVARRRVERALADLGARVGWSRATESWWWDGEDLRAVWVVDSRVDAGDPSAWRWLVERDSGRVVHGFRTSFEARGRAYPTSPLLSDPLEVELPRLDGDGTLSGRYVRALSCDAWTTEGSALGITSCERASSHALADGAGDFFFPPAPASYRDPMAEVGLYFHVDAMSAWLDDTFTLRLPYAPIRANVNFPLTNAFYGDFDGDGVPEVSFGTDELTGTDFGYDADVVYHELGHAVVGQLVPALPSMGGDRYGLEWAGGSINEGVADLFSMLLTGDPWTGEYAGSALDRTAIRDLSWPRRCPDDLRGEVHRDGEILGSFGWALIADPRVGPEVTAELLVGAVPRLVPETSWETAGRAFRSSADDLRDQGVVDEAAHAAILEHLEASRMESCGRVLPLDGGLAPDLYLFTAGLQGPLERLPGGVALSIEVPADARGVSVRVSDFVGVPGMGWAIHGRAGRPVAHEFTEVPGLGLGFAVPTEWDWVVDGEGAGGELTVGEGGLPLVPGETLYLSVASRNLGSLAPFDFQYGRITLQAAALPPAPAPAPSGCDHSGAPGVGSRLAWSLAGAAAWLQRRRRGGRSRPAQSR